MTVKEKSVEYHLNGNNCAQSVLKACGEYTGVDESLAGALSAGFGGGVRSGEICGSVSGAVMVLGKVLTDLGKTDMIASETKRFVSQFKEQFDCVRCIELKAAHRPCNDLIAYAAELCEQYVRSYQENNN